MHRIWYSPDASALARLDVVFFRTQAGREPVRELLQELSRDERRRVGADIAYVQFKWPIGRPRVDHLGGAIWEVRSNLGDRSLRVLFAVSGFEMVLLHAFFKRTRATPRSEIELAERRWKEWLDEEAKQPSSRF